MGKLNDDLRQGWVEDLEELKSNVDLVIAYLARPVSASPLTESQDTQLRIGLDYIGEAVARIALDEMKERAKETRWRENEELVSAALINGDKLIDG